MRRFAPNFLFCMLILQMFTLGIHNPGNLNAADLISATGFGNGTIKDEVRDNNVEFSRKSVKTDYRTGIDTDINVPQFQRTTMPIFAESDDLSGRFIPSDIVAMAVDNQGMVWGSDGRTFRKVYVINPLKETTWRLVHQFSKAVIHAIYVSKPSGYVFVNNGNEVYRSVSADGTDDFALVLAMPYSNMKAKQWSFTDASDGRLWISEYGSKVLSSTAPEDVAVRVYRSDQEGAPGSFYEIFNYPKDFPSDYHSGIHIHKIIWNPWNETLYFSHGDTDPNYIFKSANGMGGNWVKIIGPKDFERKLQPTSAMLKSNGDIIWGDDALRPGFWIHHIADDTFKHIGFDRSPLPGSNFANLYSMFVYKGVIYAGSQVSAGTEHASLVVAPEDAPNDFRYLDYYSSPRGFPNGFPYVAGVANDGRIWVGLVDGPRGKSLRYDPVRFLQRQGLSIDPGVSNKVSDPFFDKRKGWADYSSDHVRRSGGKYKHCVALVLTGNEQRQSFKVSGKPGILTYWARRGNAVGAGLAAVMVWRNSEGHEVTRSEFPVTSRDLDDYWRNFTFDVSVPSTAASADLVLKLTRKTQGWHYLDGIQFTQSSMPRPTPAQDHREPDRIKTVLPEPLSSPLTVLGVIDMKFPVDPSGDYTVWEAFKDRDHFVKLAVRRNQLVLKDADGIILQTSVGFPYQPLRNSSGDVLYWSLRWESQGKVLLTLATSRSNIETVSTVHDLPSGLKTVYDGCSLTADQEIGGIILTRRIYGGELSLDRIKRLWNM